MDANLQRPYQLADRADWDLQPAGNVAWDARSRMLRLRGARAPSWNEDLAAGTARVATAPGSIDRFNTRARVVLTSTVDAPPWQVIASGGAPGERVIFSSSTPITDAAIGHDGVLYIAVGNDVWLHDLHGRWSDKRVPVAGGAWRLAAAAAGCYVVTAPASGSAIVRIVGLPMRPLPMTYAGDTFRPVVEDPDPARTQPVAIVPAGVTAAGIATTSSGKLALLGWNATGAASLFVLGATGFEAPRTLAGANRPYSLTWLDEERIAVLVATIGGGTIAGIYDVVDIGEAKPVGELYPLRKPTAEPFLHGDELPPRYTSIDGVARPLLPVSWPSFVDVGKAPGARILDGERPGMPWHRIYLEAAIPSTTSIRVMLAANDDGTAPADGDWFEHRFGESSDVAEAVPRGVWMTEATEIPFHAPLLPCPRRRGVAGLFTALVQRAGRRVRTLAGRYLFVRVVLTGDGRTTPELAALRIYANRRGYAGLYLPELYREDLFGTEANSIDKATPADFLDRMLGTFESFFTPIEDRIASAWLLTAPKTVPDGAIDWLASWLGFVFAADLPIPARRAMLERAWELYQKRGTLAGLRLALELATLDPVSKVGSVTRGEIVVVEDFRLRRTFATILGADLGDEDDPLLPGLAVNRNSIVGETLFLGEEQKRAFLAVFAPDLDLGTDRQNARDAAAVQNFFDRLAHRATVLVHQEMREQDLGLLRQILDLEAPAHVDVKLVPAAYRFRVAVSSLLGVDTFLAPKPEPRPVTLDRSRIGVDDVIQRLPSLDPRLGRS